MIGPLLCCFCYVSAVATIQLMPRSLRAGSPREEKERRPDGQWQRNLLVDQKANKVLDAYGGTTMLSWKVMLRRNAGAHGLGACR
jgi:hypothetical protein